MIAGPELSVGNWALSLALASCMTWPCSATSLWGAIEILGKCLGEQCGVLKGCCCEDPDTILISIPSIWSLFAFSIADFSGRNLPLLWKRCSGLRSLQSLHGPLRRGPGHNQVLAKAFLCPWVPHYFGDVLVAHKGLRTGISLWVRSPGAISVGCRMEPSSLSEEI